MGKVTDLNYSERKFRLGSLLNDKNDQTAEDIVWRGLEIFTTAFVHRTVKQLCAGNAVSIDGSCLGFEDRSDDSQGSKLHSIDPTNF